MPAPTARARSLCRLTSSSSALTATQDLVPLPGVQYVRPPGRRLKQRVEKADDRDTAAPARRATPSAKTTSTSAPKRPRSPLKTFPRPQAATTTTSSSPTRVAKNEVSFGIVYPEKLDDDIPAGKLPLVSVRQESNRNDSAERSFLLAGQSLDRDDRGCDIAPMSLKKYCIGVSTGETLQATLARTGGQIRGAALPACVVFSGWQFAPEAEVDSARVSRLCGADSDSDGYDEAVDCGSNDPAVNPGAVDLRNDGIDQNCDGRDLTVGAGELQVTLLWNNDNDQDLHVVEPSGQEIWYGSRGPTATGGRLDRDDNVNMCGRDAEPGGVENVYWPTGSAPDRGTYRVDVVQYSSCGSPASWTVEARIGGVLVKTVTGAGSGSLSFQY